MWVGSIVQDMPTSSFSCSSSVTFEKEDENEDEKEPSIIGVACGSYRAFRRSRRCGSMAAAVGMERRAAAGGAGHSRGTDFEELRNLRLLVCGIFDYWCGLWFPSGNDVSTAAARMMSTPATLFAYMGHSSPVAAVSKNTALLMAEDWRKLPADGPRPGLFFTCGCFSCQVRPGLESFGLAAIRAPGGPPAVIGSHGESWSAMGYLAMSGLIGALEKQPVRAGEFWRAAQQGLEKAEINAAEFAILDMADGTQGKVPLEQQRGEHLEMWMLLGDPAMPLMPPPPALEVKAAISGQTLNVTGSVPAALDGKAFRITVERHPGAVPDDLPAVPDAGGDRLKAARARRARATEVTFAVVEVKAAGKVMAATIPIPANAPGRPWTVRVQCAHDTSAAGIVVLP